MNISPFFQQFSQKSLTILMSGMTGSPSEERIKVVDPLPFMARITAAIVLNCPARRENTTSQSDISEKNLFHQSPLLFSFCGYLCEAIQVDIDRFHRNISVRHSCSHQPGMYKTQDREQLKTSTQKKKRDHGENPDGSSSATYHKKEKAVINAEYGLENRRCWTPRVNQWVQDWVEKERR
ncbi:hypothetical protein AVEN_75775-1 [Araneus ventricosus]|uniref:Uncharacterized protein n=1 Tax=Araneus ventricosus TaxID=182803 RepID=A0A4Y2SVY4_ARAVE|nr:hypothetical protein AVEN_75775-1 [Araneus ventricosus]